MLIAGTVSFFRTVADFGVNIRGLRHEEYNLSIDFAGIAASINRTFFAGGLTPTVLSRLRLHSGSTGDGVVHSNGKNSNFVALLLLGDFSLLKLRRRRTGFEPSQFSF